ncbi:MAG: theronine dehydrogenase [Candidatus Latescibacterota bacterium]|nr:MAG: theronine dehydrogenase [Candidatus Latescibacterota bacterium]
MSDTMKALVYDKERDPWDETRGFRLMDVERPSLDEAADPLDGEHVIVKTIYAGFCGSDRGIWFRRAFKGMIFDSLRNERKVRRVIGHEMIGEIVEVGSLASRRYGYRPKDIVSTESHIICGRCFHCRTGETHICSDDIIIGISRDGCFAEYIKLPAHPLWPTDTSKIRMKVGAVQEPFGNAVHVCTKVDLRGKSVAVFGCGTIGLFTILIARAMGASRILGVEPDPKHREMALALGADEVFPLRAGGDEKEPWRADPETVRAMKAAAPPEGPDVAFEMAGPESSVNNAIQSVRRGGDVILFGIKAGSFQIQDFDRIILNGITLHTVIGRRIFQTWYVTKGLLESKTNGIQQKIHDVILNGGEGTIVPIETFEKDSFEKTISSHPKVLLKF